MKAALAGRRLAAQRLVGEPLGTPAEAVGHLGAVQAQVHDMSLWGVGRRCGASRSEVEAAFARSDFIRTHVLRPTWHHVLRDDLVDLLEITAPRIRQAMASNSRRDGLTPQRLQAQVDLAIAAITSDGPMTRPEVEAVLAEAGFARQGNSIAHVMIAAELTGRICSGPPRGKHHTYVAADLPPSRRTPDERLAWLAQTYARGHGPFRDRDLAWWATLTLTQAREAIDLADLEPHDVTGEMYYALPGAGDGEVPRALLLPCFDEYISYARDPEDFALTPQKVDLLLRMAGLLVVGGAVAGSWNRTLGASGVQVNVDVHCALTRPIEREIEAEAARFGTFVERPVALQINTSISRRDR